MYDLATLRRVEARHDGRCKQKQRQLSLSVVACALHCLGDPLSTEKKILSKRLEARTNHGRESTLPECAALVSFSVWRKRAALAEGKLFFDKTMAFSFVRSCASQWQGSHAILVRLKLESGRDSVILPQRSDALISIHDIA